MEPIVTGINHWRWLMPAWPNSYHFNGSSSGFLLTEMAWFSVSVPPPLRPVFRPFRPPSLRPLPFLLLYQSPSGSALSCPAWLHSQTLLAISSVWQPLFCSLRTLEELQPLIISAICNTSCSNTGATKHDGENSSTMGTDIKANLESKMLAVPWQLS